MSHRRFVTRFTALMLLALPLPALSAGGGAAAPCAAVESSGHKALPPQYNGLVKVLTSNVSAQERQQVLQPWLDNAPHDGGSADFVLQNYARLMLGAALLEQKHYVAARSRLSQVQLDSPAAVKAALLIAETFRMSGDVGSARSWWLRIAQRYPASPRALEGLLQAAEEVAADNNYRLAAGIYQLVLKQSLANMKKLDKLSSDDDRLAEVLTRHSTDNGLTVSGELVRQVLVSSHTGALNRLEHILDAQREQSCLKARLEKNSDQVRKVTEKKADIGTFETMLDRERKATEQQIAELSKRLDDAWQPREKQSLQQQLDQARKDLQAQQRQLTNLHNQASALPDQAERLRQRLEQRRSDLKRYMDDNKTAMNTELRNVIGDLRKHYMDMAGEGQMGRAQMMHEMVAHRRQ